MGLFRACLEELRLKYFIERTHVELNKIDTMNLGNLLNFIDRFLTFVTLLISLLNTVIILPFGMETSYSLRLTGSKMISIIF